MNVDYTCRNLQLTDPLRDHVEQRLQKVVKFLEEPIDVKVVLDVEKYRHIAEIHVTHRLGFLEAAEENPGSLHDAVNLAVDRAEKQARRSSKKRVDLRRRAGHRDHADGHRWPVEVLERASVGGGAVPRIIATTHLPIKPMTIEEAAIQLETAEHGFVVFRDAQSDRLSVLFKRKDDNYGLIAPEP